MRPVIVQKTNARVIFPPNCLLVVEEAFNLFVPPFIPCKVEIRFKVEITFLARTLGTGGDGGCTQQEVCVHGPGSGLISPSWGYSRPVGSGPGHPPQHRATVLFPISLVLCDHFRGHRWFSPNQWFNWFQLERDFLIHGSVCVHELAVCSESPSIARMGLHFTYLCRVNVCFL